MSKMDKIKFLSNIYDKDGKQFATEAYVDDRIEAELAGNTGSNITVEDSLLSESVSSALSANQGRILNSEIASLKEQLAELFYKAPSILSFRADSAVNEIGQTATITLTWEIAEGTNKYNLYLGNEDVTGTSSKTISINSNATYTLKVEDSVTNVSTTKTVSISFVYPSYAGVYSNEITTVEGAKLVIPKCKPLKTKKSELSANYTCSGHYIYMIIPNSFGNPSFKMGDFSGGFSKIAADATHTLYRSDEKQAEAIYVTVS